MIFHQHIETPLGQIWIVDSTENGFEKSQSETRQEFETRVLRQIIESTIGNVTLSHRSNGAPFIESRHDLFISISHSENWFALYVSRKQSVGVDVECFSTKIEGIKTHFLSENEIQDLQPRLVQLHVCWGIKESIIKRSGGEVADFQKSIQIQSIAENLASATFQESRIELNHAISRQYVLVYTIS